MDAMASAGKATRTPKQKNYQQANISIILHCIASNVFSEKLPVTSSADKLKSRPVFP